ncbi:MAG: endonuclease NucS domain-containing protein [Anaerolineae bacterium]
MPVISSLWRVGKQPQQLVNSGLESEQQLEDMIVAEPSLLSEDWMLIGRQEDTGYGGRLDLLAIEPDGSLVLIELKRGKTPRDVVAQSLDYANWVERLDPRAIAQIYSRFTGNSESNLAVDFAARFKHALDENTLNSNHKIIIVASMLDDSTERIVSYLTRRKIPLNVLFFQVFRSGDEKLLSRTWLQDPMKVQVPVNGGGESEPWNGEFYCSYGDSNVRSWEDAVEYGFVSGGGGAWYSRTLFLLTRGDRVWVNIPRTGYVGVGLVKGPCERASSFHVVASGVKIPAMDVLQKGTYLRQYIDDEERCEYFVPITWLDTVPVANAVQEIGFFGNQNTICKPTTLKWRTTVERLKIKFPRWNMLPSE